MRYPEFLKGNETIGFAAPSFGASIEPYHTLFLNALENFHRMGYETKLGPNCFASVGVGISNTPKLCGEELTDMYCDQTSQALFSVGGGELMCEILEHVDFEKIMASTPKWYMGYSDNTNFIFILTTICDVAGIYGPCAPSFGMEPWHKSHRDAMDFVRGMVKSFTNYPSWEINDRDLSASLLTPYNCTEPFNPKLFDENLQETDNLQMEGRLVGGCMDCLSMLCGTKFDKVRDFCEKYRDDGIIWFLESCDLNTFSGRRTMWQLKEAGWFNHIKGVIFGRPGKYTDETFGLNWQDALLEHVKDLHIPVIMNADLGHLPPMMPFISGAYGKISAIQSPKPSLKIDYILK